VRGGVPIGGQGSTEGSRVQHRSERRCRDGVGNDAVNGVQSDSSAGYGSRTGGGAQGSSVANEAGGKKSKLLATQVGISPDGYCCRAQRFISILEADRGRIIETREQRQVQEGVNDIVNSGSSEQLEFIEPSVHVAGAVDSQDGSE
jgi:hypothetical protein